MEAFFCPVNNLNSDLVKLACSVSNLLTSEQSKACILHGYGGIFFVI